jgi:hypothetical protein
MSHTPRSRRWPGALTPIAQRAGQHWQPRPSGSAENTRGADICPVDQLSFWRVVNVPYPAWLAALDHWQLTAPGSEFRLGPGVLCGPAGHDPHFGTCQIQARLGRGPLRRPLRMRLEIDRWSPTATALALICCQRARPATGYFRAGRHLLDTLTRAAAACPPGPHWAGVTSARPPAEQAEPKTARPGGPAAGPAAIPAHQGAS